MPHTCNHLKLMMPVEPNPPPPLLQLASIGLPNEEGYRRDLREMLFTAPDVAKYISGVVSICFICFY
jgi:hypothetical protein